MHCLAASHPCSSLGFLNLAEERPLPHPPLQGVGLKTQPSASCLDCNHLNLRSVDQIQSIHFGLDTVQVLEASWDTFWFCCMSRRHCWNSFHWLRWYLQLMQLGGIATQAFGRFFLWKRSRLGVQSSLTVHDYGFWSNLPCLMVFFTPEVLPLALRIWHCKGEETWNPQCGGVHPPSVTSSRVMMAECESSRKGMKLGIHYKILQAGR